MKKLATGWTAALVMLVSEGSLPAHHALTNFDTTKAVRIKGTIIRFHSINPHSFIYLEQRDADGQARRWAIEGPSNLQLSRSGFSNHVLKPGAVIEVCGYLPTEAIVWQIASADPNATSTAGRLINAELLITSDGQQQSWGDYGVHKCFEPGHTDQHSK